MQYAGRNKMKSILITLDENGYRYESTEIQEHEAIGLLTMYAARLTSNIVNAQKRQNKEE